VVKKTNIIELNGKRYDALSGTPFNEARHHGPTIIRATPKSIDGFSMSTNHVNQVHPSPVAAPAVLNRAAIKPRALGVPTQPHKPERPNTLMRSAVQKPGPSVKRQLKPVARTDSLVVNPIHTLTPKQSAYQLDARRALKAQQVARSQQVQRFGAQTTSRAISAPLLSVEPPTKLAVSAPQPVRTQSSMDIFERALARANSHTQEFVDTIAPPKARRGIRRTLVAGGATFVILVVGVLIAYQNIPNIQLKLASSRAGFAASLPTYRPQGYNLGTFAAAPGAISVRYDNRATNSSYTIREQTSNMDSDSLRNDFVSVDDPNYNTVSSAGLTIFTYDNNNASWVNNGVWYQLSSNGSLSTTQLIDVASSL
jgi:hypothetical protein